MNEKLAPLWNGQIVKLNAFLLPNRFDLQTANNEGENLEQAIVK